MPAEKLPRPMEAKTVRTSLAREPIGLCSAEIEEVIG